MVKMMMKRRRNRGTKVRLARTTSMAAYKNYCSESSSVVRSLFSVIIKIYAESCKLKHTCVYDVYTDTI